MAYDSYIQFLTIPLLVSKVIPGLQATVVKCNGAVYNGSYYEKDLLVKDIEKPYNLVIDTSSDQLFFSHTIWLHNDVDFAIMICDLKTKFTKDLKGIPGGYAVAYDKDNDRIYLGGHGGIYTYNTARNTISFFAEKGKSIWTLFIRNDIYYIEYPTQQLYVYSYSKAKFVRERNIDIEINTIFVSKSSEYYYSNDTALFKKENLKAVPIILHTNITVKQIAEDTNGNIFFCASDGIYIEDKSNNKIINLAKIDNAFGMTFDGNGRVIFANQHAIYRLLPSKYNKLCLKVLAGAEKEEEKRRRSFFSILSLPMK